MSMMMSVASLANKSTDPLVPAAMIAALPTMNPCSEFKVAAKGCGWPVGHMVINPSGPGGTTVTLNEYACAIDGMVQVVLDWMGTVRLARPFSLGRSRR